MPGLLAAQRVPVLLHLLEHVAVPHRRLDDLQALPLQRQLEPEVRHDRRDDGVGAQCGTLPHRQREYGHDLVAVHLLTGVVDGEAPVRVTVVRDAERGPVLDDRGLEQTEVGGTAALVDVEPGRLGADGDDLGTGLPERLRRDPGGGAVRLVEDDLQPVQPVGQHADEVGDVLVGPLPVLPHAPHARARRPVPRGTGAVLLVDGLDTLLQLVVELVPAAGEELDPVVGHGVVARGEHDTEVGAELGGEEGDRGGRQHAHLEDVDTGAGEARDDGGFQELPGRARVPSDHGGRAVTLEGARLGQYVRRGDGEAKSHLGRQIRVGDTAHAVRAEESSHLSS